MAPKVAKNDPTLMRSIFFFFKNWTKQGQTESNESKQGQMESNRVKPDQAGPNI